MTISIIIPCFNAEGYVAETIESILAQTYTDWELLLVNDGSQDGTQGILERYSDGTKIRCVELPDNIGISGTRNIGTRLTTGQLMMHTDADDLLPPTALQEHVNVLQEADVSYSGYVSFERSPEQPLGTFTNELPEKDSLLAILAGGVDAGCWWVPPGAMLLKREADVKARQQYVVWNHRIPVASDLHYYACLYQSGAKFASTKTIGLYYRRHSYQQSRQQSFVSLFYENMWMLDFWIKELGPIPQLIQRKAGLYRTLQVVANIEVESASFKGTGVVGVESSPSLL